MGCFGSSTDFVLTQFSGGAKGNIVGNGVVEEQHFLCDQRHLLTQAVQMHRIDGVAINTDLAPRNMKEIGQQISKGALAAARGADQRNLLSRAHLQADMTQCIPFSTGVAIGDVIEHDFATHVCQRDGTGISFSRLIQHGKHMFSRSQTTLNGGIEIGQALQRRVHHQAGSNERDKTTDGGHAFGRLHHGYGDDNGHGQRR